jgi:arginyl-tRNA synthetase
MTGSKKMYTLEELKSKIVEELNGHIGEQLVEVSDFEYPPNLEMGELSYPCFKLAKAKGESPAKLSQELVSKMQDSKLVAGTKSQGPYLNFSFDYKMFSKNVVGEIQKKNDQYGENEVGEQKRVMIEYSNANTHKEYHVGHLRNICYGDAVSRIIKANGYDVIPVSYINDFGIHVAKTLWAYLEFYKDEPLPENKGRFLGEIYVRASQEIAESKTAKDVVAFMMKKIEMRQGAEYELWKKTREWSIEQFDKIYKELGVEFDNVFYESDFIEKGLKRVDELLEKGILKKSEGAIISDLEEEDLSVLMFKRSDGTALYPVADIPLASYKIDEYRINTSIYVVDVRQSLYFKQLFRTLEKIGYKQNMVHLGYEFVTLPGGTMSSRSGNVITYEELKEKITKKLRVETSARHVDWSEEKLDKTVKVITNGAIKFELIKVGASQIITFDIEKSLSFSGYTAAYLQYTFARIKSIIRKSEVDVEKIDIDSDKLLEIKEHELVLKMSKYPGVVERAGREYDPSVICKYLFELAQNFNDYYHSVNILKSEENLKVSRLVLALSVSQVLKNGLNLVGVDVVEEM